MNEVKVGLNEWKINCDHQPPFPIKSMRIFHIFPSIVKWWNVVNIYNEWLRLTSTLRGYMGGTKFTKPRWEIIFDYWFQFCLIHKKNFSNEFIMEELLINEKVSWELERLSSYISSMIKCRSLQVKCHIFSPFSCNCLILKYICCQFLPISISISKSTAWLAFKKIFRDSQFQQWLLDRKP